MFYNIALFSAKELYNCVPKDSAISSNHLVFRLTCTMKVPYCSPTINPAFFDSDPYIVFFPGHVLISGTRF
jgi:hypothetical protein